MLITNNKLKKALIEIEKVVYGKIKHLNNQARILHIGEILSKVIDDGRFIDDDEECEVEESVEREEELQALYQEFYEAYETCSFYSIKVDEIEQKIKELKKQ